MTALPTVSVVVPSYNHARFLKRRMDSILEQTYPVEEVLFLDDASTDGSLAEIAPYLTDGRIRVVANAENSGCAFVQWNRGVKIARGEYVWIAESDDYADPRFLETLVSALERHPAAGLAYCRSVFVDSNGRMVGRWESGDRSDRWETSFVNSGIDECRRFLVVENTIPNASAVVFRREVFLQVGGAPETMRIAGDWVLWAKMLSVSDVAYEASPLSFFREHAGTVRWSTLRSGRWIEENFDVLKFFLDTFPIPGKTANFAFLGNVDLWLVLAIRYLLPCDVNGRILARVKAIRRNWAPFLAWRLAVVALMRIPVLAARGIATRAAAAFATGAVPSRRPDPPPDSDPF